MRKSRTSQSQGRANFLKEGSYNVICDYSGQKFKAEDTRMTWDGFRVGKEFWESRHPQDFTAIARDTQYVPNARPGQSDEGA